MMSQIRCSLIVFFALLSANSAYTDEIGINCHILDKESKIPLSLKLKKGAPMAPIEDEQYGPIPYALETNAVIASEKPLSMKGFQKNMDNGIDWELLDYQPLDMLGLNEGNVQQAVFHYAKEDEASGLYDLILVSVDRKTNSGEPEYAGSYGTYKGSNFICPTE